MILVQDKYAIQVINFKWLLITLQAINYIKLWTPSVQQHEHMKYWLQEEIKSVTKD